MLTIRRTARSCPTILLSNRRSKSRTSVLRSSGSSWTSSEMYGLTIVCTSWAISELPLVHLTSFYAIRLVCRSGINVPRTLGLGLLWFAGKGLRNAGRSWWHKNRESHVGGRPFPFQREAWSPLPIECLPRPFLKHRRD